MAKYLIIKNGLTIYTTNEIPLEIQIAIKEGENILVIDLTTRYFLVEDEIWQKIPYIEQEKNNKDDK